MIAALPMYDLPELRAETDALWAALREALRGAGVPAPEALARDMAPEAVWRAPDLALAQTCGLPFVRHLRGRVHLAGLPDHGIEGCPPGWYRSVVIAREGDARGDLSSFAGARLAVNGPGSQSGAQAIMHHVEGRHFGEVVVTGAHEASMRAVAEGRADIAAIDAVTWALLSDHRPSALAGLRELMRTDPTPGLPYVSSRPGLAGPVREAIASLGEPVRRALRIRGAVAVSDGDYDLLAERDAAARPATLAHGLIGAAG